MNTIHGTGPSASYLPPYGEKGHELDQELGIGDFATEIFQNFLSYLDFSGLRSASMVSRSWHLQTNDVTKREISLMRRFATFLGENLQKEHAIKIEGLLNSENPLFINIIQTQASFIKMKEGVLNILKDLTDEELNNLEELSKKVDKPIFFEDLFILARIYREIIATASLSDDAKAKEQSALLETSKALTECDYESILLLVKTIVQYTQNKVLSVTSSILKLSCEDLIKKGDFEKAIKIAKSIPDSITRMVSLEHISKALVECGNFEKAKEVANTIPILKVEVRNYRKNFVLREIALVQNIYESLIKSKDFKKAKEALFHFFRSQENHWNISQAIIRALVESDNLTRALIVISRELAQIGSFEMATHFANSFSSKRLRAETLKEISDALVKIDNFEEAIQVINFIPSEYEYIRTCGALLVLQNIFDTLIRKGNFDRAIRAANSIFDESIRASHLKAICEALYTSGKFEEAIRAAKFIPK